MRISVGILAIMVLGTGCRDDCESNPADDAGTDIVEDLEADAEDVLDVDVDVEADVAPEVDDAGEADTCVPEADDEFCLRLSAAYGELTGPDNCGDERVVTSCGDCDDSDSCTFDLCDTDSHLCVNAPLDADGDGYAASEVDGTSCDGTDCDDANDEIHPGADEIPGNTVDEDCNGSLMCFYDGDHDGYGTSTGAVIVDDGDGTCTALLESDNDQDCDDLIAVINPAATEITGNTVDEDCDGGIDCWLDGDGDGYGSLTPIADDGDGVCEAADNESTVADDCEDGVAAIHPGAAEICADGIDNDCDGAVGPTCRTLGDFPLAGEPLRLNREGGGGNTSGWSIAVGPDTDGGGGPDLMLGSPTLFGSNDGGGYLFGGPVFGIHDLSTSAMSWVGVDGEKAATAVAFAGDVDNDGDEDIVFGAPEDDASGLKAGAIYVFRGPTFVSSTVLAADAILLGGVTDERLGYSLASLGDINANGSDDLVVGAPRHDYGGADRLGAAYLVDGYDIADASIPSIAWATIRGVGIQDDVGWSVANAGDVNDDGVDDLVIGAPNADDICGDCGAAYVVTDYSPGDATVSSADAILGGMVVGSSFGYAVAGAGDVNGDGFDDLLIGAPQDGAGGVVYLFYGPLSTGSTPTPSGAFLGAAGDAAGTAVAGAGDVDGDGLDDILIGAPASNGNTGTLYLVFGPATGIMTADASFHGAAGNHLCGQSAAAADNDGDGYSDIYVGCGDDGAAAAVYVIPGGWGL